MLSDIINKVESSFNDILRTASDMIRIPSRNPPGEEKRCADYIYSRLKELGYDTYLVNEPFMDRPQVVALKKGKSNDAILLNGHIDTVPEGDANSWSTDPFSGAIKDGFLYGRGAVDMKSGLAVMMHATKLVETDASILLTFAVGEERAEPGTSTLLSWLKKFNLNIKYGLVMEPTGLRIATQQKGAVWFKISIGGKAAHASAPNEGVNAIEIAYDVIQLILQYDKKLAKQSHEFAGSPTCSITTITGGIKENVIPDKCEIVIDRRLVPGESVDEVEKEIRSLLDKANLDLMITRIGSREPVQIPNNCALARTLMSVMRQLNMPSNAVCFSGATDNEHLINYGIESLVWGPGDLAFAHAVDERIDIQDIKNASVGLVLALNKLEFA